MNKIDINNNWKYNRLRQNLLIFIGPCQQVACIKITAGVSHMRVFCVLVKKL